MGSEEHVAELFEAIQKGETERVRAIIKETPDLAGFRNDQGVGAIMVALYHRQPQIATLLTDAGNVPDMFECAALGSADQLKAFLETEPSSISVHAPDGFTLLHLACFFDHIDIARLLIERGSDVNAIANNPSRVTPIHSAAACGSTEIVTLLLEHDADPNSQQHGDYTPLMSAAMHGNAAMAEALLAHNASLNITAEDGRTARDMAREAGHEELALRLEVLPDRQ